MSRTAKIAPMFVLGSIATVIIGVTLMVTMLLMSGPPGFAMRIDNSEDQPTDEAVQPTDGETVHIVDYGVSVAEDADGNDVAAIGVVVSNTSNQLAVSLELHFRLIDTDGDPVSSSSAPIRVPPIPPGTELGVGAAIWVDAAGLTDVELSPQVFEWWEPDTTGYGATFTTSDIVTVEQTGSDLRLAFQVDAEAPLLKFDAGVVYRDDDGAIIGGSDSPTIDKRAAIPSGMSQQELVAHNAPDGTAHTDVYIHQQVEPR